MHSFPDLLVSLLPHPVNLLACIDSTSAAAGRSDSDFSNSTNSVEPSLTSLSALAIQALNLQLNKSAHDLGNTSPLALSHPDQRFVLLGFE